MRTLKTVITLLLLSTLSLMATEQKVVFDLSTGDVAQVEKGLVRAITGLVNSGKEHDIDYRVAVVISGKSYKFFVKDLEHSPFKGKLKVARAQKQLAPQLKKLHERYGVEFTMCQAGMRARKIDPKVLYPYVKAERNKNVYLVDFQNRGYAYLPVH